MRPGFGLVLATAGIMIATGLALPRVLQLPPDVPAPSRDVPRMVARVLYVLAALMLVLGWFLTPDPA